MLLTSRYILQPLQSTKDHLRYHLNQILRPSMLDRCLHCPRADVQNCLNSKYRFLGATRVRPTSYHNAAQIDTRSELIRERERIDIVSSAQTPPDRAKWKVWVQIIESKHLKWVCRYRETCHDGLTVSVRLLLHDDRQPVATKKRIGGELLSSRTRLSFTSSVGGLMRNCMPVPFLFIPATFFLRKFKREYP